MLAKAVELAEKHGWYLCRQFENEANADAHSRTTAQEIITDFAGERLDYWVSGFGTGGTVKGVARALRQARPATKIVVAEPGNSPLLGSGIAQQRNASGAPSESHPRFRPHLMQGWTPDFISKLAEDAVASGFIDEIVRSRATMPCAWRARSHARRGSLSAPRAARRWRRRSRSRAAHLPVPISSA
jgi:cysteine synthase A